MCSCRNDLQIAISLSIFAISAQIENETRVVFFQPNPGPELLTLALVITLTAHTSPVCRFTQRWTTLKAPLVVQQIEAAAGVRLSELLSLLPNNRSFIRKIYVVYLMKISHFPGAVRRILIESRCFMS